MGTIVGWLSFLTLQHGNALGDAPRHRPSPRSALKALRTAWPSLPPDRPCHQRSVRPPATCPAPPGWP
ncbi:hypothetical protein CCL15_02815 [Pseudomonas syringae]|nr:hypothetical protein CCL15_02815 [Pseudomonas syringae]